MYGVLPDGVFDGAPLTSPRGVVKSNWGNHQVPSGLQYAFIYKKYRDILSFYLVVEWSTVKT